MTDDAQMHPFTTVLQQRRHQALQSRHLHEKTAH
jgi:hypothetical protein